MTYVLPVYAVIGLAWWLWCTSNLWLGPNDDEERAFAWSVLPRMILFWPLDVAHVLARRGE